MTKARQLTVPRKGKMELEYYQPLQHQKLTHCITSINGPVMVSGDWRNHGRWICCVGWSSKHDMVYETITVA